MAISVQPDDSETNELAGQFMGLMTEIGNQLNDAAEDPAKPLPPDYWTLRTKQTLLAVQIQTWLTDGIQLDLDSAGQAIDSINQSTQMLNSALQMTKSIAMDVGIVSAFVDVAVAITAGQPQAIVAAGKTLIGLLKPATV